MNSYPCLPGCTCRRHTRSGNWNSDQSTIQKCPPGCTCNRHQTNHRTDRPGYAAVHRRLRIERGRASEYQCIECGKQADQWSYVGTDDFSANLDDYVPRCHSCHRKFDGNGISPGRRKSGTDNG